MRKLLLVIFVVMFAAAGRVAAQPDPYGTADTVSIDRLTVGAGNEFTVHVNLWNDEVLGAVTIPLVYPIEKLEFKELSFAGSRLEYISTKPVTIDQSKGTILVGAVVIMEEYLQPGQGSLFSVKFRLKETVAPEEVAVIDSAMIPPVAELILAYYEGTTFTPIFSRGEITSGSENRPPVFAPIPELYVAEGESLFVDVRATDADEDSITLADPVHPINSRFEDHGDGTGRFVWRPDFVGPQSSDRSPFSFTFWASDGKGSNTLRVKVNVINVNRPPQIIAPTTVEAEAGDSVGIQVSAQDPDFNPIQWQVTGLPAAANFNFDNPGLISWKSAFADSGQYQATLIATDAFGGADTTSLTITMKPVTLFSLRVDTLTSFVGQVVTFNVSMKNRFDIKEFRLLIHLDPSVLTVLAVTLDGTRAEDFDYLNHQVDYNGVYGDLRIASRAGYADPIPVGDGPICRVTVQVSSDVNYVGNEISLRFVNHFVADNVLIMTLGQTVISSGINFFDGYIMIGQIGNRLLGDINLNGVAYEIADAVYFTNFFISPGLYPIDGQRLINSDVNQDGFAPSIADLVMLIKIVAGQVPRPGDKPVVPGPQALASLDLIRAADGLYLAIDAPVTVGGLYVELAGSDVDQIESANLTEMELVSAGSDGCWRGLMFSYDGNTIPSGGGSVIRLSSRPDLAVALVKAEVSDADGRVLNIDKKPGGETLPTAFELFQNYPNPFNPTTSIRFDLAAPSRVTLAIYNILGQEVIRLADGDFPAGSHAVVWDGRGGDGRTVASGIYIYRISAGGNTACRRMALVK
ncbi:MAG: FlgD immunoglobulin-like domain containing protein [candidate division Zixibacteria bacterium]|nr:FlgD immunoglobulin-like domain containing protein [candidate division Zixibacteria bacterium]